jgi:hypothetical protein
MNYTLWDGPFATPVLTKDSRERGFDVNDFDTSAVIRKQVNPPLPCLAQQVCGAEGERLLRAEEIPASFLRVLDDDSLIVGGLDIEFCPNVVQRHDRQIAAISDEPMVFATTWQSRHHRNRTAVLLMRNVMQISIRLTVEQKACLVVLKRIMPLEAIVLLG